MAYLTETVYATAGRAEVWKMDETYSIKYFDSNGTQFYTNEFPNSDLSEVKKIAEDWASGDSTIYG